MMVAVKAKAVSEVPVKTIPVPTQAGSVPTPAATPALVRGRWRENFPMAKLSTWRAGGPASAVFEPADLDDLKAFLASRVRGGEVADGAGEMLFVGHGSNLLVRDGGFPGVVVRAAPGLSGLHRESDGTVFAEAGASCAKVARFCAGRGLAGAEFLAGIPGATGGALAMNAGCNGGEVWQFVERVRIVDDNGVEKICAPSDFVVNYREVRLKKNTPPPPPPKKIGADGEDGEHVVGERVPGERVPGEQVPGERVPGERVPFFAGAWLRFPEGDAKAAKAKLKALLDSRRESQPLTSPSAGSVFRNPPGDFAGRLIEACGMKGAREGGAEVSRKHANFIVNIGGARARDVESLMRRVQDAVRKQTGVSLIPEVRIVGREAADE